MCHRRKSIRALTPPCATSLQGIAGINYTYTSLPARTKIPGSSYTACVDDVYNGIVDFCAADFWCAIRLSQILSPAGVAKRPRERLPT